MISLTLSQSARYYPLTAETKAVEIGVSCNRGIKATNHQVVAFSLLAPSMAAGWEGFTALPVRSAVPGTPTHSAAALIGVSASVHQRTGSIS